MAQPYVHANLTSQMTNIYDGRLLSTCVGSPANTSGIFLVEVRKVNFALKCCAYYSVQTF